MASTYYDLIPRSNALLCRTTRLSTALTKSRCFPAAVAHARPCWKGAISFSWRRMHPSSSMPSSRQMRLKLLVENEQSCLQRQSFPYPDPRSFHPADSSARRKPDGHAMREYTEDSRIHGPSLPRIAYSLTGQVRLNSATQNLRRIRFTLMLVHGSLPVVLSPECFTIRLASSCGSLTQNAESGCRGPFEDAGGKNTEIQRSDRCDEQCDIPASG